MLYLAAVDNKRRLGCPWDPSLWVVVKVMKFDKSAADSAFAMLDDGGRWRIRTPVSGSEGRKDIQTTLIARIHPERTPLLEEGG